MEKKTENEAGLNTEAPQDAADFAGNPNNPPILDPVPIGEQTGIDGTPVGVGGGIGEMAGLQGDPADTSAPEETSIGGLVMTRGGIGQMADLKEDAPAEGA